MKDGCANFEDNAGQAEASSSPTPKPRFRRIVPSRRSRMRIDRHFRMFAAKNRSLEKEMEPRKTLKTRNRNELHETSSSRNGWTSFGPKFLSFRVVRTTIVKSFRKPRKFSESPFTRPSATLSPRRTRGEGRVRGVLSTLASRLSTSVAAAPSISWFKFPDLS